MKRESESTKESYILNISQSRYPLIEEVAKTYFDFKITKEAKAPWDILWTDSVPPYSCLTIVLGCRKNVEFEKFPKNEPFSWNVEPPYEKQPN